MRVNHNKRNTLALKGISIVLGLLLWLFVTNENIIITNHPVSGVSVTAENLGAGLKAVYNNSVDLEVSGKVTDRALFKATVDLNGMGAGKHQVPVRVKTPSGVKLVKVVPAQITVNIMEVTEKTVPVGVHLEKDPPVGYRVTGMIPSPAQVLVRGGYPDVIKVDKVQANVDLSEAKTATTLPLTFTPVDREGQVVANVSVVPEHGQAYVVVEADKKEISLPIKIEVKGYLADGYSVANITAEPTLITVYGNQEVVSQLKEVVTEPVDIEGKTESIDQVVKLVAIPDVVFNPTSVLVRVEIKAGSANP
ncbi:MAG: YbbR-like domain-containing protein [Methylocystaceae bacterium]